MTQSVFLETHNLKNKATGLGTFNYELIKGLSKLDWDGLELTLNAKDPTALKAEFGNQFKYNQYNNLSRHWLFRTRKKYDLWHAVNQNTKVEPFHVNKYLLTVHDVNFVEEISSDKNHRLNRLFAAKLRRATAITYISEFAKKQTHQYFDIPDVAEYVIYNGNPITTILDTSKFVSPFPTDKPFLYSIGDFLERKNFLAVVKMMATITDLNLIISGNNDKAYGKQIQHFIDRNQLTNRVFLTGKVDELAKQYYLSHCTAFVFPSIREGFGLPPIEAMHYGKPVFLSDKTSLPEIGGEHAYYWNDFDPDYMKKVLYDGLNHFENNRTQMEQLIKKRASRFDWKDAAAAYLQVYKKCLS